MRPAAGARRNDCAHPAATDQSLARTGTGHRLNQRVRSLTATTSIPTDSAENNNSHDIILMAAFYHNRTPAELETAEWALNGVEAIVRNALILIGRPTETGLSRRGRVSSLGRRRGRLIGGRCISIFGLRGREFCACQDY